MGKTKLLKNEILIWMSVAAMTLTSGEKLRKVGDLKMEA